MVHTESVVTQAVLNAGYEVREGKDKQGTEFITLLCHKIIDLNMGRSILASAVASKKIQIKMDAAFSSSTRIKKNDLLMKMNMDMDVLVNWLRTSSVVRGFEVVPITFRGTSGSRYRSDLIWETEHYIPPP
jgi:predicted PolB exonuclease-like 3'-5' exonuclease